MLEFGSNIKNTVVKLSLCFTQIKTGAIYVWNAKGKTLKQKRQNRTDLGARQSPLSLQQITIFMHKG